MIWNQFFIKKNNWSANTKVERCQYCIAYGRKSLPDIVLNPGVFNNRNSLWDINALVELK